VAFADLKVGATLKIGHYEFLGLLEGIKSFVFSVALGADSKKALRVNSAKHPSSSSPDAKRERHLQRSFARQPTDSG
jgi:hypothetical protein